VRRAQIRRVLMSIDRAHNLGTWRTRFAHSQRRHYLLGWSHPLTALEGKTVCDLLVLGLCNFHTSILAVIFCCRFTRALICVNTPRQNTIRVLSVRPNQDN
jgi:hypothetical protein